MSNRFKYRPRLLSPFAQELMAVAGLCLIVATFGFWALYAYSFEMGLRP